MSLHLDTGIQGFSKPHVDLALWAADDRHQPHEVRALLSARGIWFTPCLGSYKGKTELSYLTTHADFNGICHELCEDQESVLILGGKDSRNRHSAHLEFMRTGVDIPDMDLGRCYSVPIAIAHKREAWTIPLNQPREQGAEIVAFVCDHVDKFGEPDLGQRPSSDFETSLT